jgi:hypothetical protein
MSTGTSVSTTAGTGKGVFASWPLTETTYPTTADTVRGRGLVVGGAGLAVTVLGGLIWPWAFFPAYLAVYLFFLGLGLGSLGLLMLHYLVGGAWGFLIRRPLEAAIMTLPLSALLFLPLLLGLKALYPWADPEAVKESAALAQKAGYLNVGFWLGRAVVYHAIWSGLALLMRSGSARQDQTEDPSPTWRTQAFAGPGLVALFLSITFAMIDWGMSIEPEWYSTIYGVMLMIGFALSSLSLGVIVATALRGVRPLSDLARADAFHDLGNLMLAFTMLWAYMSFSQYLVIWMGNLSEEVPWYLRRSYGGWWWGCALLILVHFFVPFFLLLMRENKREPDRIWRVAALLLAVHFVNDVWLILPAFPGPQWVNLLALVPSALGVGGLWAWAFAWLLGSRPLVPLHDPMLAAVLEHQNHAHDHAPEHDHGHKGGGH